MSYQQGYDWAVNNGRQDVKDYENALRSRADKQAGNALQRGDYAGAKSVYLTGGYVDQGLAIDNIQQQRQAQDLAFKEKQRTLQEADAKVSATNLGNLYKAARQIPEGPERDAFIQTRVVPFAQSDPILGRDPSIAARLAKEPHGNADIDGYLRMTGQYGEPVVRHAGDMVTDAQSGAVISSIPDKPQYMQSTDANGNPVVLLMNPQGGGAPGTAPGTTPGSASAAAPGAPAAPPKGGNYDAMYGYAKAAGANPQELTALGTIFQKESAGGANTKNPGGPSSQGWFQFHPDTFNRILPGGDINNPADQTKAALLLLRQDEKALSSAGLPTDQGTLGLAHQQGLGGATTLLSADPTWNAIDALTPAYGGNRAIARKAIVNNGGTPDMTAGQFVAKQRAFYGGAAPAPAPAGAQPSAAMPSGPRVVYQGVKPKDKNDDQAPFTEDTINYLADGYRSTGTLPPMGMGPIAAANRAKILQRAQERDKAEGVDGTQRAANQADYAANKATLKGLQTQRSAVNNAEGTALKNADVALGLLDKGAGQTGSPYLNKPLQAWRRDFAGNPDVSSFDTALKTFSTEFARVMTAGPNGGGQLSDSARHEVEVLLDPNATPAQIRATVDVMKRDMKNRSDVLDGELARVKRNLGSHNGESGDKPQQKYGANYDWMKADPHIGPAKDGSGDLYYNTGNGWARIDVDEHGPYVVVNGKKMDVTR